MDDDFEPGGVTADEAGAKLGRRLRTHRQRRRSIAPWLCTGIGVAVSLLVTLIAGDVPVGLRTALIVVPVAFVIGFLTDYLAPRPGRSGRLWLTVHTDGVVVDAQYGGAEAIRPVRLAAATESDRLTTDTAGLSLVWPQDDDEARLVPLDSFAGSRALRRALVDRAYTTDRWWLRSSIGALVVVVWAAAWWGLAPPDVPRGNEDLGRFCADEDVAFSDAPAPDGRIPVATAGWAGTVDGDRVDTVGVAGLDAALADRGWVGESMSDTALVACFEVTRGTLVDSCGYSEIPAFGSVDLIAPAYLMNYEFTIHRADDRTVIAEGRVDNPVPDGWQCPENLRSDQDHVKIEATPEQLADALINAITG